MNNLKGIVTIGVNVISNLKIPILSFFVSTSELGEIAYIISISYLINLIAPRIEDVIDEQKLNGTGDYHSNILKAFCSVLVLSSSFTLFIGLINPIFFNLRIEDLILIFFLSIGHKLTPIITTHFKFNNNETKYSLLNLSINLIFVIAFLIIDLGRISYWLLYSPILISPIIYSSYFISFRGIKGILPEVYKFILRSYKISSKINIVKYFGDQGIIFLSGLFLDSHHTGLLSLSKVITSPLRVAQTYYQNRLYFIHGENNLRDQKLNLLKEFWKIRLVITFAIYAMAYLYFYMISSEELGKLILLTTLFIISSLLNSERIEIDILVKKYNLYKIRDKSAFSRLIIQLGIFVLIQNIYSLILGLIVAILIQIFYFDKKIKTTSYSNGI